MRAAGVRVVGVSNNENESALPIAMGLIFVVRALNSGPTLCVSLFLIGFVASTGSRTSTIAMALYLDVALI